MKKKYLKTALVFVLTLTVLSLMFGCTSKDDTNPTTKGNDSVNKTDDAQSKEKTKPVTITYMTTDHGDWSITQDTPVLKKIEETIGARVEFIPLSQDSAEQKINTVFASGEMPDCMNLAISKINQYGSKAFIALDEHIENSMPSVKKLADAKYKMSVMNSDGHIYGIPLYGLNRINKGVVLRGDLLEKYNLEKPKTIDEFENVLRMFKNGDPNCIPLGAQPGFKFTLIPVCSPSFGLHFECMTIIDGKMVLNATTDNYKELITWLAKLYADGLLDQEYVVRSSASWEESIGLKAMTGFTGFYVRSDMLNNSALKDSDAYLVCIPPLEGPNGEKGAVSYSNVNINYNTAITKNCKNINAAVKYIDFLFSDEGRILTAWGIEGEHYTKNENGEHKLIDKAVYSDYAKQAKIGINQQMFPRYWDPEFQMAAAGPQVREALGFLEGLYIDPLPTLNYSPEALQETSEIWATLETYIDEYTHNVITGKNSISNWDTFQNDMKKYKVERYMELVNEAYAQYLENYEKMK